jgi:hypothetical protein
VHKDASCRIVVAGRKSNIVLGHCATQNLVGLHRGSSLQITEAEGLGPDQVISSLDTIARDPGDSSWIFLGSWTASLDSMNVANLVNPSAVESKATARQNNRKYTLTDFQIQRTLGTGSFGQVHVVTSKHDQRHYGTWLRHY